MTDRYTKFILTVIAMMLTALVVQQAVPQASAQFGLTLGCDGSYQSPCFIRLVN